METELSRELGLEAVDCFMEVGVPQTRQDIIAVLMLADEMGGAVTAAKVSGHLLMGRPERMGELVIARCADFGVLDREGNLTPAGKRSLNDKLVFVPETGRYRIQYANDSLLESPVVRMRPIEEPAVRQSVRQIRTRRSPPSAKASGEDEGPLPETIAALRGAVASVLQWEDGASQTAVHIRSVGEKCVRQSVPEEDRVSILWGLTDEGAQTLRLKGPRLTRDLQPPPANPIEVLEEVLVSGSHSWDRRTRSLSVALRDTKPSERRNFRRAVVIEAPRAGAFGQFARATVKAVPLRPATDVDADKWARWLMEDLTTTHTSPREYSTRSQEIIARFGAVRPKIPTQSALATRIRDRATKGGEPLPPSYWHFQAPLDLRIPED